MLQEGVMKRLASTTGIVVAVLAATLSAVWAFFIPYGYPWPSVAWAILACAAALSVVKASIRPSPSIGDVINDVEAESPRASTPSRRVAQTRAVL